MFLFLSILSIGVIAICALLSFFGAFGTNDHGFLLSLILLAFDYIAVVLSSIFIFRLAFRQIVGNTLLFVLVSLFWIFAVHIGLHFLSSTIDEALNITSIKGIVKLPPIVFLIQVIGVYWFAKTKLIQGNLLNQQLTRADEVLIKQEVSHYNEVTNTISGVKEYD